MEESTFFSVRLILYLANTLPLRFLQVQLTNDIWPGNAFEDYLWYYKQHALKGQPTRHPHLETGFHQVFTDL